jgi:hypothetical protein
MSHFAEVRIMHRATTGPKHPPSAVPRVCGMVRAFQGAQEADRPAGSASDSRESVHSDHFAHIRSKVPAQAPVIRPRARTAQLGGFVREFRHCSWPAYHSTSRTTQRAVPLTNRCRTRAVSSGNRSTKKWPPGSVSLCKSSHRFRHSAGMSKSVAITPFPP